MNIFKLKPIKAVTTICSLLISAVVITACGGGAATSIILSGIGGTGIVFGPITGFGSIYANGNKFEVDGAQFIVDGVSTNVDQGDLSIGMVVKLKVEVEDGVYTGNAIEVIYDDELEGPVETVPQLDGNGNKKTFTILGYEIEVDQTTTLFNGTSFDGVDAIALDDVLEISGFRTPTKIVATYVEMKGTLPLTTKVELKGAVAEPLTATTFMLGSVEVDCDPTTCDLLSGEVLTVGQAVEVKGDYVTTNSVTAADIEFEDEGFGDDVDDVEIQGIVTDYTGDVSNFKVSGQTVNASNVPNASALLQNGINIEVEGEIANRVLIADELEIKEDDTRLRSTVTGVPDIGDKSFRVSFPTSPPSEVVVRIVDGETIFEDEAAAGFINSVPFSLDDLIATDFVRIEGQEIAGEVVASVVKRTDVGDTKLRGAVNGFADENDPDPSITVLGITYPVDITPVTGTEFEVLDLSVPADDFFTALGVAANPVVEIKDDEVADGIADEVELE